jgi:diacylglycerol kinase (ATP)
VPRLLAVTGPRTDRSHVEQFRAWSNGKAEFILLEHPTLEQFAAAVSPSIDCIVLFGGDGTLNRYLGELLRAQVPVLPVPSGSGNDFARALGIPNDRAALDILQSFVARSPDHQIARCNADIASLITHDSNGKSQQQYFSCCVNVGLDADAAARANHLPAWLKQRGGYFLGGLGAIVSFTPERYNISLDGQGFEQALWFITVLNTPTYGGGLKIAPHADIFDRKLDYVSCRTIPRLRLFQHIPKLITGKNLGSVPYLDYRSIAQLTVQTPAPSPVYADGEFMGFTPIEVSLAAKTLPVLRRNSN